MSKKSTKKVINKLGIQYRDARFDSSAIDEEDRTVELSFSSEAPVERWFGTEILDHSPESVRLGRLENGAAFLADHNFRDHVGVVESVSLGKDRRGRAIVRMGNSARAEEIFRDILDGIRSHISFGYRVHKAVLEETGDDGDVYRVTDWEPYEISIVSVPADASVGVGRSQSGDEYDVEVIDQRGVEEMPDQVNGGEVSSVKKPVVTTGADLEAAREIERARIRDIQGIGGKFDQRDLAEKFVESGGSVAEFNRAMLDEMGSGRHQSIPDADIGLTNKEKKQFRILRLVNALANPTKRSAQEAAAFEFEVSDAAKQKGGRDTEGVRIPYAVLNNRDLMVGTAADGGDTVSTDLLIASFVEMLYKKMVLGSRVRIIEDLVGNIAIPRQTSGATAYWLTEGGVPTESQAQFDQIPMTAKTIGAFTDASRKFLIQSSLSAEQFIRADLARALALELDRVIAHGSGVGSEPRGIANTAGIGAVIGGANGGAPTWDHIVNLETEVAADDADLGSLLYVSNAKVRGKLKTTEKASGTAKFILEGSEMNGYDAAFSNQIRSDFTKGAGVNLSAILFGNFADVVMAMWSGVDVLVDPYTNGTAGAVRVIVHQDVDLAVRHAQSFSAMLDAVTQ